MPLDQLTIRHTISSSGRGTETCKYEILNENVSLRSSATKRVIMLGSGAEAPMLTTQSDAAKSLVTSSESFELLQRLG